MWLRPQGYAVVSSPERSRINLDRFQCDEARAGNTEYDTLTCGHCGRIIHVKAKMRPEDIGGLCKLCMKYECPSCVDKGCVPFEKRLEMQERRDIALRSYGF